MERETIVLKENQNAAEILNDLVKINNDRIEGYETAAKETKDSDQDLRSLFNEMKTDSLQFRDELSSLVTQLGDDPSTGTRTDGKIYRAWMDVKATLSGNSRKSILENCEYGEDAAQRAYESALEEEGLPANIRNVIYGQKAKLNADHNRIKLMRDLEK